MFRTCRRSASVLTAALLALSCGGGGSSPATPSTPSTKVSPTPAPTIGVGASCRFGQGTIDTDCEKSVTLFQPDVNSAIDLLITQKPSVFDLNDSPAPGIFKVVDPKGFVNGIVANLIAAGFCAQPDYDYPLERINAKNSNDFSEDFDLISSTGYLRRGSGSYRQTCTPAAFPVVPDPSWPPSGSGCGKPYPPPISRFNSKIWLPGNDFVTLDSTAIVGPNVDYCQSIGYIPGQSFCPVRVNGDPEREPCEEWAVGKAADTGRYGPTWTVNGEYCKGLDVNGCQNHDYNQYELYVSRTGIYVMCSTNGACGKVEVDR